MFWYVVCLLTGQNKQRKSVVCRIVVWVGGMDVVRFNFFMTEENEVSTIKVLTVADRRVRGGGAIMNRK